MSKPHSPRQEWTRDALCTALAWQISIGSDEVIADQALNRFLAQEDIDNCESEQGSPARAHASASYPPHQSLSATLSESPISSLSRPAADSQSLDRSLREEDSLAELKDELSRLEGLAIKTTATHLVFGEGVVSPLVMFIGEAPGADEDRQGRPFVGRAGQLLDKMIGSIHLSRHDNAYITNIVPWRPPGNRTPNAAEITTCLPFVKRHVALVKPRAVVALGGVAASALTGNTQGIMRLRGQWRTLEANESEQTSPIPLLSMFHPAFLLRQPMRKRETWQDLRMLQQYITSSRDHTISTPF